MTTTARESFEAWWEEHMLSKEAMNATAVPALPTDWDIVQVYCLRAWQAAEVAMAERAAKELLRTLKVIEEMDAAKNDIEIQLRVGVGTILAAVLGKIRSLAP